VELLLEKGAVLDARNREMATPFALAAWRGGLDAAKVLLEKGADIEAKNLRGQTPLFYAAAGPNAVNLVTFLIQRGADINVRDTTGITALTMAIDHDRGPAIEILRTHGAVE
jgi:ankyrin repeat protein